MDIKGLDHFVKYCEIFVVISVSFRIFYKEMKAEGNLGFLIYNFYIIKFKYNIIDNNIINIIYYI